MRVAANSMLLMLLAGCSASSTQSLQEHTADATAAAKRDAVAITKGVAEGLVRKGPVNVNSATEGDLERLPGVNPDTAKAIIARRPYRSTYDLLRKHVVTRQEFDRLKSQIVVH